MAFTIINTTDTLEQMRQKLNSLTQNDFGDPSLLAGAGISATSVVGAVVQLAGYVGTAFAIYVKDSVPNTQLVGPGDTINFLGTANQINAVVSSPKTVTFSLPSSITISGNLTSGGLLTTGTSYNLVNTNATTINFGGAATTLSIAANSGTTTINNNLTISGTTLTASNYVSSGNITINTNKFTVTGSSGNTVIAGTLNVTGLSTLSNLYLSTAGNIQFEGATNDSYKTTLTVVDPTGNRTLTLPNVTGTIVTTGDTGTVTSTMIADGTIVNADIADGTIRGAKFNTSLDSVTFSSVTAASFTGTASLATNITLTDASSTNSNFYIPFSASNTGNVGLQTDTDLYYNPSSNTLYTTSLRAQYADLAEKYNTDQQYDIGTVIMVGGSAEVTASSFGKRAIGVITEKPAYLMNANGTGQPVALKGKVPVKVNGNISKGDELIADNNGLACKVDNNFSEKVFAIALEDSNTPTGTSNIIQAIIL